MDHVSLAGGDARWAPVAAGRDFTARLHGWLLAVAWHEAGRRSRDVLLAGFVIDDVVPRAVTAALRAIAGNLDSFRGQSQGTTWASKFVMRELSISIGCLLRDARVFPLDRAGLGRFPDPVGCQPAERGDREGLLAGLRRSVDTCLSSQQRAAFTAIALNAVPADVLAAELDTNRNSIYKALFEARRTLRAVLTADGYLPHAMPGSMTPGPRWLDDLLAADMGDAGCELTFEQLDRYAEAHLNGHDPQVRFQGVAAHLRGCQACHEDLLGLFLAFAQQNPVGASPRGGDAEGLALVQR